MNTTPTAAVPNKYRNDLTAGARYGQLNFTEQPLAAQYVACLGCPVRDLCPVPTPWPRGECCRRGHVSEKYANGACKACNRTASEDARKRAEESAIPADVEDLRVQFVISMRRGGFGWEEIIRDLRTKSNQLGRILAEAGSQRGPRSCECSLYREARWLDLHSWWRHAAVRLWWSLSTKLRWWIVDHWPIKGRCTCDLCDSVLKAEPEWRADYLGQWNCLCDFPLPIDAGVPMRGRCYCAPLDGGHS